MKCHMTFVLNYAPYFSESDKYSLFCPQVVITLDPDTAPLVAPKKPKPGPWLDSDLAAFMLESFLPLVHTEEQRQEMFNNLLTTVESDDDKKVVSLSCDGRSSRKWKRKWEGKKIKSLRKFC